LNAECLDSEIFVNIRPATPADIPRMMDLERACATAAHWTESQYQQVFQLGKGDPLRLFLVADGLFNELSNADAPANTTAGIVVLGFLVARLVAPEWELENIVVAPTARRIGLGKQLLDALLATARETNSDAVFLEVRESNTAARDLYEKAGFKVTGRRKSYYTDPREDAVLYRRILG
jgi:ribosomal-protein-alanine N-acetyltransferase